MISGICWLMKNKILLQCLLPVLLVRGLRYGRFLRRGVRVYLEVDESVRVGRIHKRELGDVALIRRHTHERDTNDYERYKRLYDIDIKQYKQQADLLIDANVMGIDEVVETILHFLIQRDLIQKI